MKFANWIAIGVFAVALTGLALPATAQTDSDQRAAASREATELLQKRLAFFNVNESVSTVLHTQQAYEVARANSHMFAMHNLAAEMIAALADARYWTNRLDRLVTTAEFSQKVDEDVATLNEIVGNALNTVLNAAIADDLGKLNEALDNSADTFSRLETSLRNVSTGLWPQLAEG